MGPFEWPDRSLRANEMRKWILCRSEKGERQMRRMMVVMLTLLTLLALTAGIAAAERMPIIPNSLSVRHSF